MAGLAAAQHELFLAIGVGEQLDFHVRPTPRMQATVAQSMFSRSGKPVRQRTDEAPDAAKGPMPRNPFRNHEPTPPARRTNPPVPTGAEPRAFGTNRPALSPGDAHPAGVSLPPSPRAHLRPSREVCPKSLQSVAEGRGPFVPSPPESSICTSRHFLSAIAP